MCSQAHSLSALLPGTVTLGTDCPGDPGAPGVPLALIHTAMLDTLSTACPRRGLIPDTVWAGDVGAGLVGTVHTPSVPITGTGYTGGQDKLSWRVCYPSIITGLG